MIFVKLKNTGWCKINDDFNYGQIYMIDKDINNVINIGSTCFSLKKCLPNFKKNQNQYVIGFMIIFTIWFIHEIKINK